MARGFRFFQLLSCVCWQVLWVRVMVPLAVGAEIPPDLEQILAAQDRPLHWIQTADLQFERVELKGSDSTVAEWHRWRRGPEGDEVEERIFHPSDPESFPSHCIWSQRGAFLRYYEEQEQKGQPLLGRGDIYPVTMPDELPYHLGRLLMIYPLLRPNREIIQAATDLAIVDNDSTGMTIEFTDPRSQDKTRIHFLASEGYWIDVVEGYKDGGKTLRGRFEVEEFWNLDTGRLPRKVLASYGDKRSRWRIWGRINEADLESPGELQFPPGKPIDDHLHNEYHIWGDGKPSATFKSDKERRDWIRQQRNPSPSGAPGAPRPTRSLLFWANLILFGLLALIYGARHWIKSRPAE